VPTPEEKKNFNLFSLQFFRELLPKHKTDSEAPIRSKDFSRDRKLTLPIVLSLIINMIRPGKRFGYQEVLTGSTATRAWLTRKTPIRGRRIREPFAVRVKSFPSIFSGSFSLMEAVAKLKNAKSGKTAEIIAIRCRFELSVDNREHKRERTAPLGSGLPFPPFFMPWRPLRTI